MYKNKEAAVLIINPAPTIFLHKKSLYIDYFAMLLPLRIIL